MPTRLSTPSKTKKETNDLPSNVMFLNLDIFHDYNGKKIIGKTWDHKTIQTTAYLSLQRLPLTRNTQSKIFTLWISDAFQPNDIYKEHPLLEHISGGPIKAFEIPFYL